jgi:hypothetical protein
MIRKSVVRRVGKGALGAVPTISWNVFALNGGHAIGRAVARPLALPTLRYYVLPSSSRNGYTVVAGGARRLRRASKDGPRAYAAILRDAAQARGSSG